MRSFLTVRALGRLALAGVSVASLTSCASELTRTGSSPVFVIVNQIEAASGAEPDRFGVPLLSDVETIVESQVGGQTVRVRTFFNDLGRATFRLGLKNPGTQLNPTSPTPINEVVLNRYHVNFRRSDGRNNPGTDVPYPFDGGITITIPAESEATAAFEIVRNQAKLESPLKNLAGGGGGILISTIAEVTFYGHDMAGNEVIATANISVNFGDFADPAGS